MAKNRRIRDTSVSPRDGGSTGRRREVLGVVCLGAAIFLLIALTLRQLRSQRFLIIRPTARPSTRDSGTSFEVAMRSIRDSSLKSRA